MHDTVYDELNGFVFIFTFTVQSRFSALRNAVNVLGAKTDIGGYSRTQALIAMAEE